MDKQLVVNSQFIRLFTESIIKTVAIRKYKVNIQEIINMDLVPSISDYTIINSMGQRKISPDLSSIPRPLPSLSNLPLPPPSLRASHSFQMPKDYKMSSTGEYGKLEQFLKENSITVIECSGPNKEITIVRDGDKQLTKVTLSKEEINKLLELIAKKSNLPIIEGVFKAQVDNFEINAVISDVIGTRFILRKETPYNLIKKPQINNLKI